ncbi:hypothetical protein ACHAWF_000460, partial [Thalassiosira exigua]
MLQKVDTVEVDAFLGSSFSYTYPVNHADSNKYNWYRSFFSIENNGATTLSFDSITAEHGGEYGLRVTNTVATGLTLNPVTVKINVSEPFPRQLDSLALVNIYNDLNGAGWTKNTNWLSDKPINEWYGVTIANNRVIKLDFSWNKLTGRFPNKVLDLTELQSLIFYGNSISGEIPSDISKLNNLTTLNLGNNQLTGTIPISIGELTKLTTLGLANNKFTGTVPSEFASLIEL